MAQQHFFTIADQRAITPRLHWLTLHAPELARASRAGQYLLVRCAEAGSYDPLLRRPLFLAAAEPALGQVGLLYEPAERGLSWLARGRTGEQIDALGPFGQPFMLDGHTRSLLLIGSGPGLGALLLLASAAAARRCAVTLIAEAETAELLPPPFLLPSEVEYQTFTSLQIADYGLQIGEIHARSAICNLQSAITWADQLCVALPRPQLRALAEIIRGAKYRWERGFASALLEGPLLCGVGACGVCAVDLRKGPRMLCSAGPVFDMLSI